MSTTAIVEVIVAGVRTVPSALPLWIAVSLAGAGLWELDRWDRGRRLRWAMVAGAVGISLCLSLRKAWLADDAFISFRYAQNFASGLGLVFNPGEWVEGYTNFLWTIGLGLLAKAGVDIPLAALCGTLLSQA